MRKLLLNLLVLSLCTLLTYSGYSQTVQIGTGTSVPAATLYSPVYRFSATSTTTSARSNILFTQAEMTAAGIPAGATITAIEFNKGNAANFVTPADFSMYMANTSNTSLATSLTWASIQSTHTQIYTNSSFNLPSTAGWVSWSITPFVYTGGALEIATELVMVGNGGATSFIQWEFTSGSNSNIVGATGTTLPATLSGSVAAYKERPNIKITYTPATPCTSPPTPGTASVSNVTPCPGENITLNLSGNTAGSGQTYDWESTTSLAQPFISVNGPSISAALATSASNTSGVTYYRCAVTCGSTVYSDTISVNVPSAMAGTYTIDKNSAPSTTNFQSFTDAMNTLKCATMAGNVTFNVVSGSGPYNEQLIIDSIPGISSVGTLTINGNGETITYTSNASTAGLRPTVKLNGADYTTIKNLTIEAAGTTYGWGVQIANGSEYDSIINCTINVASTSTTQSNSGGIIASGSETSVTTDGLFNNITILNNTISGGYQGIILTGLTASPAINNHIYGNTIQDFYADGISLTENMAPVIDSNDISRATRATVTTFTGIELGGGVTSAIVNGNRIHDTHNAATTQSGAAYGIYANACDASVGAENKITNNLIYNMNSGTGTIYALYNSNSDGTHYFHNTIVLDNTASTAGITRGFYQTTGATNIELKNNIVYITRGGTGSKNCLYFGTTTSTIASDNNILYMNATAGTNGIGYFSSNQVSLANWQGVNGGIYDLLSTDVDPIFSNPSTGNYEPASAIVDNLGIYVGVTEDINNNPRDPNTPDIGAYEFSISGCLPSAIIPGTVLVDNTSPCPGTVLNFDLLNNSIGLGQTYTWEEASAINGTYSAVSGALSTPIFSYTPTATGYYRCAVTCGATTLYSDTVLITVQPLFPSNTYTINSAGGGDFLTLADAAAALSCGIAGPVTFNVAPGSGPYTDSLYLGNIYNASATNTITFNGNGASLLINTANTNERAGFKLDGSNYVTINDFVIVTETGSTYGFGIQLLNDANNNIISNNVIYNDTTATSSNFAGIVLSSSATSATGTNSSCDSNQIINNIINGGYYSITLMGVAATPILNNVVKGNTIQNFYYYGIYVNGNNEAIIDSNDISRPTRTTISLFNGVYFTGNSSNCKVNGNRVHNTADGNMASTSANYGIMFTSCDATAGNENIVSNNLLYNFTNAGLQYAFNSTGSDYVKYYHNTVSLDDATATCACDTRGLYQTTAASGIEWVNNIVTITRGGTGDKHGIFFNTPATLTNGVVMNNNVYYINSTGANNYVGYDGTNRITMLDWQTATSQEGASVSLDPHYTDPSTGNFEPMANMDNLGVYVNIDEDINGASRSSSTPDIGAYEFFIPVCSAPPTAGTSVIMPLILCAGNNANFGLSGNSTGVGQTYTWESSPDPATVAFTPISGAGSTATLTEPVLTTAYYRCAVTCSGITSYSDTVLVTASAGLLGNYTIDKNTPTGGTNFNSFTEAVNTLGCGILGNVIFDVVPGSGPYTEQISIPQITGASATSTLTINGHGNTLTYAASASAMAYTLELNGADYVNIHDLTIEGTGSSYALSCHLWNGADNDSFVNCTFIAPTVGSGTSLSPFSISCSGTSATTNSATVLSGINNVVMGCTMTGGYYNTCFVGNSATPSTGNQLLNCTLEEFYIYGSYNYYQDGMIISGNTIERPTRGTVSTFYGIYVLTGCSNLLAEKNIVRNPFGGVASSASAAYGVYSTIDASLNNENKYINNLFYDFNGNSGAHYGLYLSGADYVQAYHNTIVLDNATSTAGTTYGIYSTGTVGGIDIKNNNIYITRAGTGTKACLYYTSNGLQTSNYNNLYINAPAGTNNIGSNGSTGVATLSAWQTANATNPWDANSVTLDPAFVNNVIGLSGNYKPTNPALNDLGTPTIVIDDINGAVRNTSTPDMGAYEFTPCTGALAAGNYTINATSPTGGNNFNSFSDMALSLLCGIGGHIIVDVAPASGPYNEQLIFPTTLVTSSTSTITINGNGNTLASNSNDATQRAAVKLDGTDYVTIDGLTIDATNGSYGWGIQFINDADHNKITNCTILASQSATTSNALHQGIVFSGSHTSAVSHAGNSGNYDTIINNTINGGYYGIAVYGPSTSLLQGMVISGNTVTDQYAYSILVLDNDGAIVSNNDISRPTRTNTAATYRGIYLVSESGNNNQNVIIEKNRIHNIADAITTTFTGVGIDVTNTDAPSAAGSNMIRNNAVYNMNNNGIQYGLNNNNSDYVSYYFNTIALDRVSDTSSFLTSGFNQSNAATGIDFRNNLLYITRGGTGNRYAVNLTNATTASNPLTLDHNVYYVNSATGVNNTGAIAGANKNTLNDWQTAFSPAQELNTVSADPLFTNPAGGDFTTTNNTVNSTGITITGISTDINNTIRSATPDAGAFENLSPTDVNLLNFSALLKNKTDVLASWEVATEKNMSVYEVERSEDGKDFHKAGSVKATGNAESAHYEYTDRNAASKSASNRLHYRLKMVEESGKFIYSPVRIVSLKEDFTIVSAQPVPFNDKIEISVTSMEAGELHIRMMDMSGKLVSQQSRTIEKGLSTIAIYNLQHLSSGAYMLHVELNGKSYMQKIVK